MKSKEIIKNKISTIKDEFNKNTLEEFKYDPLLKKILLEELISQYTQVLKDLERLEKLEKAIDILKDNLHLYKGLFNCLSINGGHEYIELTNQEYELLKEVFGDE